MNLTSQKLIQNPETKFTTTVEGVAAYKDGQYWGCQYKDGQITDMSFGPLVNASISNPKYCLTPLYMARGGKDGNGIDQRELRDAKLVKIRKTVVIENLGEYDESTT